MAARTERPYKLPVLSTNGERKLQGSANKPTIALQVASECGQFPTVELLLKEGADVNALSSYDGGRTAFQAAAICGVRTGIPATPLLSLFSLFSARTGRSCRPTLSPHAISLQCLPSVAGIAFRYPLVSYPLFNNT